MTSPPHAPTAAGTADASGVRDAGLAAGSSRTVKTLAGVAAAGTPDRTVGSAALVYAIDVGFGPVLPCTWPGTPSWSAWPSLAAAGAAVAAAAALAPAPPAARPHSMVRREVDGPAPAGASPAGPPPA